MNKETESPFDERSYDMVGKICIILFFISTFFLLGDMLYRKFAMHQTPKQYGDIFVLFIGNIYVFFGLQWYYSGVGMKLSSLAKMITLLVFFIILKKVYFAFKYGVWAFGLTASEAMFMVSGFAILLSIKVLADLGKRRIERDVE